MKKLIAILSLTLATSAFSQEISTENKNHPEVKKHINAVIVEHRQEQIMIPSFITKKEMEKANSIIENYEREQELLKLDIEKLNIRISQEMLYDTPSQRAINRLIDDKVKILGKMEKNKFDVNFKLGKLEAKIEKEVAEEVQTAAEKG